MGVEKDSTKTALRVKSSNTRASGLVLRCMIQTEDKDANVASWKSYNRWPEYQMFSGKSLACLFAHTTPIRSLNETGMMRGWFKLHDKLERKRLLIAKNVSPYGGLSLANSIHISSGES